MTLKRLPSLKDRGLGRDKVVIPKAEKKESKKSKKKKHDK